MKQEPDLGEMTLAELRELWRSLYKNRAGDRMRNDLLRLALAQKLQENATGYGKRVAKIRRRAETYTPSIEHNGLGFGIRIRTGTRFVREYKGAVHEVLAVEGGRFVYKGEVYRSLSAVATAITGRRRLAGTVFFGMRGRSWRALDG